MKKIDLIKNTVNLRQLTPARVALGKSGSSLNTQTLLQFDLDHARARDAVHLTFEPEKLRQQLQSMHQQSLSVTSKAGDRDNYLKRPDLGRKLDDKSLDTLQHAINKNRHKFDLALIIADGLSTSAIHQQGIPFLQQFLPMATQQNWKLSPIIIASQARVALADEIGSVLQARTTAILIGERPGLSSADSMGIYFTYEPRPGRTDAERNCISNIHQNGLSHQQAAQQLSDLINTSFRLKLSGVNLKLDKAFLQHP